MGYTCAFSIVQADKKEDDSVYSLFSDEMRDEYEEQPPTPRRSGLYSKSTDAECSKIIFD